MIHQTWEPIGMRVQNAVLEEARRGMHAAVLPETDLWTPEMGSVDLFTWRAVLPAIDEAIK